MSSDGPYLVVKERRNFLSDPKQYSCLLPRRRALLELGTDELELPIERVGVYVGERGRLVEQVDRQRDVVGAGGDGDIGFERSDVFEEMGDTAFYYQSWWSHVSPPTIAFGVVVVESLQYCTKEGGRRRPA